MNQMTDPTEAIRKALEAGHTSALYTHPRDDNNWMANEAFASACNPAAIRALLDRLDSAERDQRRYQWLRGNVGEISTSAFEDMQFYGEPGDTQDALRLDAAIDAAMRAGEQK